MLFRSCSPCDTLEATLDHRASVVSADDAPGLDVCSGSAYPAPAGNASSSSSVVRPFTPATSQLSRCSSSVMLEVAIPFTLRTRLRLEAPAVNPSSSSSAFRLPLGGVCQEGAATSRPGSCRACQAYSPGRTWPSRPEGSRPPLILVHTAGSWDGKTELI